jgi:hypothetical protein
VHTSCYPYTGIKKWWGLIKTLYGNKIYSNIPVLVDDDRMIIDSKEKATLFNNYFCSVHEIEQNDVTLPRLDVFQNSKYIDHVSTTDQEINILLKNVDVSKACGYDGISNMILKICADCITSPLCKIINRSFSQGVFPSLWKFANVLPLFKLEVTNARKLLPHGQNFELGCSKSGYNPWIIQK